MEIIAPQFSSLKRQCVPLVEAWNSFQKKSQILYIPWIQYFSSCDRFPWHKRNRPGFEKSHVEDGHKPNSSFFWYIFTHRLSFLWMDIFFLWFCRCKPLVGKICQILVMLFFWTSQKIYASVILCLVWVWKCQWGCIISHPASKLQMWVLISLLHLWCLLARF